MKIPIPTTIQIVSNEITKKQVLTKACKLNTKEYFILFIKKKNVYLALM